MSAHRRCLGALALCCAALAIAAPAAAQEEPGRTVQVSFDVGGYDEAVSDWVVDSVEVTGDLVAGAKVTVELRGAGGRVLWTGTQDVGDELTRIDVGTAVAVGDVVEAAVSHAVATAVEGVQVVRPHVAWSAAGGGAGRGQLALSMVLAVIIVAVLFRSPLPSASSERWTR